MSSTRPGKVNWSGGPRRPADAPPPPPAEQTAPSPPQPPSPPSDPPLKARFFDRHPLPVLPGRPALWLAAVLIALGCAALRATGWHPASVPITARFSHTGDVTLVFNKQLTSTTSPACGCIDNHPPGGWDGIAMPGSDLELGLAQSGELTQYDMFSPDPGLWAPVPGHIGLEHVISIVVGPTSRPPTSGELETGTLPRGYETVDSSGVATTDWLSIESRSPLQVTSSGREPLAAVGPAADEPVTIRYEAPQSHPDDQTLQVRVPFGRQPAQSGDNVPLTDVIGAHIVLWTRLTTSDPRIAEVFNTTPPSPYVPYGPATTENITPEQMFPSLPKLEIPAGSAAWLVVDVIPNSTFAVRVVARPGPMVAPPKPGVPIKDGELYRDPYDGSGVQGQALVVSVPKVSSGAAALRHAFALTYNAPRMTLHDVSIMTDNTEVASRDIGADTNIGALYNAGSVVDYDYPPTPPVTGIKRFRID
jgi:hypothetical protein